jgi:DNA adenine methylase
MMDRTKIRALEEVQKETISAAAIDAAPWTDLRDLHPFVKWAGGKSQLLPELNKMIPSQFNTYFEPFLGGGAMFFHLVSTRGMKFNAYLSDINTELITAYEVIKVNPKGVIELLQTYDIEYKKYPPYSKQQQEYYLQLRDARNNNNNKIGPSSSSVEKAARFIALNKTCFNGLYRVNKRGEFNVPPGKYNNPVICDYSNLKNVSYALTNTGAIILADDYRNVTQNAQKGDFIYLDPPYQPLNNTSYFTAYTTDGFDNTDQQQLASVFRRLNSKGCLLLLSNSDTTFIRALYSDFSIKEVNAQRAINCKSSKRAGHKELLISNPS